jgi:hypothetical protein
MRKSNLRGIYYLILIGVAAAILTAGLISLQPGGSALNWLIRGVALLGYLAIYLSILSHPHTRANWSVSLAAPSSRFTTSSQSQG